ncbi:MAG TPA: Gfo/Idh/MocA family oxidoreductase [Candidatus Dormibacteraeota bacterium]|nr:Gfo/Idh/MocA family oxidoreductase [Candidatus Dormibacteraeota bacterium]
MLKVGYSDTGRARPRAGADESGSGEIQLIRTLVVAGRRQAEDLAPWLAYMGRTGTIEAEVTDDVSSLTRLAGFDVIVAHPPEGELLPAAERALCEFVQRGGGFLGLHCTNATWAGAHDYLEMVGGSGNGRLPKSEIVSQINDGGHDITRRLAGELRLHDSCYPLSEPPSDCQVLLDTTWQARRLAVAYVRQPGAGRVFYWGMGEAAATFRDPDVQELLYRGVRYAAGQVERSPVGIGMLGFGAIGGDHASSIAAVPGLTLAAIADQNPTRVAKARELLPEVPVAADLAGLLDSAEVELVIISTPPNTHAQLAEQALRAGKHVVLEKPFCLSVTDADRLVELAREVERTLTVFQNRRWDADYLALHKAVRAGQLGSIFHLEAFVGGYGHPCHFWHSHAPVSGGVIFDWGSHYLDWILQLVPGLVVQVAASRQKLVWQDVTNDDHFELRMTFAGGAEAIFMHSDIAAARKPKWYVLGTGGAAVGYWRPGRITSRGPTGLILEERIPVTDLPCELHILSPDGSGESHDQLVSLPAAPPHAFYRNLAGHLLAEEPLAVTPESARRNVAVMEAATRSAEQGHPIDLRV